MMTSSIYSAFANIYSKHSSTSPDFGTTVSLGLSGKKNKRIDFFSRVFLTDLVKFNQKC